METLQMLGNLGEFVGAFAVVATLIYLTIQVRHSRGAMEENSRLAQAAVIGTTFDHLSQFSRHSLGSDGRMGTRPRSGRFPRRTG